MLLFGPPYFRCHNDSGFRFPPSWLRVTTSGAVKTFGDVTFSVAGSLNQRNIRRWHVKNSQRRLLLKSGDRNSSLVKISQQTLGASRAELNRRQWHVQLNISQGYNSYAKLPEVFCPADTSYLVCKAGDNENSLHHTLNRRVKMMTSRMSLSHSSLGRDVMLNLSTLLAGPAAYNVISPVTAFKYARLRHWDRARCRMRPLEWQPMRQIISGSKLYSSDNLA